MLCRAAWVGRASSRWACLEKGFWDSWGFIFMMSTTATNSVTLVKLSNQFDGPCVSLGPSCYSRENSHGHISVIYWDAMHMCVCDFSVDCRGLQFSYSVSWHESVWVKKGKKNGTECVFVQSVYLFHLAKHCRSALTR